MKTETDDIRLSTEQLAERWNMDPDTLKNWRVEGRGPAYVKLGKYRCARVFYCLPDVLEYERKNKRTPRERK